MAVWNWINANASQLGLIVLIVMVLVARFFWKQLVDKTIPSYMEEKGKNLATKQDVEEITRKTEQVQKNSKRILNVLQRIFTSKMTFILSNMKNCTRSCIQLLFNLSICVI